MSLSFVSSAVQVGTADGGFEETPIENTETAAVNRRNAHKPLFEQLRSNQEAEEEKQEEARKLLLRSTCALDDEDVAHLDSLQKQKEDRVAKIKERTLHEVETFRAAKALWNREQQQAALNDGNSGVGGDDEDGGAGSGSGSGATLAVGGLGSTERAVPAPAATTTRLPAIKVKKRKRRTTDPSDTGTTTTTTTTATQDATTEERNRTHDAAAAAAASNSKPTEKPDPSETTSTGTTPPLGTDSSIQKDAKKDAKNTIDDSGGGLGGLLCGYGSSSDEE